MVVSYTLCRIDVSKSAQKIVKDAEANCLSEKKRHGYMTKTKQMKKNSNTFDAKREYLA